MCLVSHFHGDANLSKNDDHHQHHSALILLIVGLIHELFHKHSRYLRYHFPTVFLIYLSESNYNLALESYELDPLM